MNKVAQKLLELFKKDKLQDSLLCNSNKQILAKSDKKKNQLIRYKINVFQNIQILRLLIAIFLVDQVNEFIPLYF